MQLVILTLCAMTVFFPGTACAYVGPGLGLGAIGAVLGVLLSIFLAFIAILWYPLKRIIRKFKKKKENHEAE